MSSKFQFLLNPIQAAVRGFFRSCGYDISKSATISPDDLAIIQQVKQFTGTSNERISGLIEAIKYLSRNQIEGDMVECGVWRGGSMMAAMLALRQLGDTSRDFYLFDTFEGMTTPTEKDVMHDGTKAAEVLNHSKAYRCIAGLEDVKRNVYSTGYPKEKIHFVKGRVEDTVPQFAPQKISLLRLDTDWYESTKHELLFLYPRLIAKGILIIDDYGHWQGSRAAVDEYFLEQAFRPFLSKMDFTGRVIVKP